MASRGKLPLVLLTTHLPKPRTEADIALRTAGPAVVFDVLDMLTPADIGRLATYAIGGVTVAGPGFWTAKELDT
jgi:hypothetical protein